MQSFFNKVGKTAASAASKAGNKAGELIEIGKLRGKISSQKQDINSAKRDIGEYCYDLFKEGKLGDDNIKELCDRIESCEKMIKELEEKIEEIKKEYDAEKVENDQE